MCRLSFASPWPSPPSAGHDARQWPSPPLEKAMGLSFTSDRDARQSTVWPIAVCALRLKLLRRVDAADHLVQHLVRGLDFADDFRPPLLRHERERSRYSWLWTL